MSRVSSLLQNLVVQLLYDPQVRERIAATGVAYQAHFMQLQQGLAALGLAAPGRVGLNLWLPLPDAAAAQALPTQGWLIRPGTDFCLQTPPGVRLTSARLQPGQTELLPAALRALRHPVARTALA